MKKMIIIIVAVVGLLVATKNVDAHVSDGGSTAYMLEGKVTNVSEASHVRCVTTSYEHLLGKNLGGLQTIECKERGE